MKALGPVVQNILPKLKFVALRTSHIDKNLKDVLSVSQVCSGLYYLCWQTDLW